MTNYSNYDLMKIWQKGAIIHGSNSTLLRKESEGNVIKWDEYGQMTTYGWEVDHIIPIAKGESDTMSNLQPLHWEANRKKSDKRRL